jgi:hypothetical protein
LRNEEIVGSGRRVPATKDTVLSLGLISNLEGSFKRGHIGSHTGYLPVKFPTIFLFSIGATNPLAVTPIIFSLGRKPITTATWLKKGGMFRVERIMGNITLKGTGKADAIITVLKPMKTL